MKTKPRTDEQQAFRDRVATGGHTKGVAYAGCGKTYTLVLTSEEALVGRRVGNFCFNRSTKDEANGKYPAHVKNYTFHAYAVPTAKAMRFFDGRKSGPMGVVRGFEDRPELRPMEEVARGRRPAALAAMQTITKFCQSDKRRPLPEHVPSALISKVDKGQRKQAAKVAAAVAGDLWDAICAKRSEMPMTFDHYLKAWALTDPELPFDTILLDEAQDSNPVTLSVFMAQDAQQVYTGDSYQQIYAWRGAVDAMEIAPGEVVRLTHSFRFGPEVADRANEVLELLGETTPLVGRGDPGEVIDDPLRPVGNPGTVLCRGNAGVIRETLSGLDGGRKAAVVGGTDEAVRLLEAAYTLYDRRKPNHPELGIFDDWGQLQEFSETDEGGAYKPIVRLVEDHGDRTPILCDRLKYEPVKDEKRADLIVTTAHKAKGREWDDVRFAGDFGPLAETDPARPHAEPVLHREECNLVYVSVTRAQKRLNLGGYGSTIREAVALMGGTPRRDPAPAQPEIPEAPGRASVAVPRPGDEELADDDVIASIDAALLFLELEPEKIKGFVAYSEARNALEEAKAAVARARALAAYDAGGGAEDGDLACEECGEVLPRDDLAPTNGGWICHGCAESPSSLPF